ncbi:hypothetical protein [Helicobacter bizzozeronii]|uniref:hypothetical protein n=1 Tax=Helicobacter bizzozeronii TaxID=56877 RepID=UPI0018F83B0F|nr:hypothetical protein [Helicobacter bizzozeronii]
MAHYGEILDQAIKSNIPYSKLPENVQRFLARRKVVDHGIFGSWRNLGQLYSDFGEQEYKAERVRQSILKVKHPQELTKEQNAQIFKDEGYANTLWDMVAKSNDEILEAYQEKIKSRYLGALAARDLLHFKNSDPGHSFFNIFSNDPELQRKSRYAATNVMKAAGFDDVIFKKGRVYGIKDGEQYRINEGFFDNFGQFAVANAGSLTGGLIGSAKGLARTKNLQGAIAGGAIGAFLGGSVDYAINNYVTDR